jgi:serine/threonine protein kinase
MGIASSGMLIDTLRQHNLLTPGQLAELPQLTPGRCSDARSLAKTLIQKGWMTVYQSNQLLLGKARELVIGPYRVVDKLGQGGLSSVFKARHLEYDYLVAIKMIRSEVFASEEGRQQFLQEVEAMARLDHANIVQFCDADQWEDTYYFAMEYVEGTDLGKVIRLSGALSTHESCDYIRQAAMGLQHAYERNLIHRDIKPVNLFLTYDYVEAGKPVPPRANGASKATLQTRPLIKILDWGLASLRSPRANASQSVLENLTKNIVGTADYLSPDQARNANSVDIRGDIYSLGCTFYYLLTGQPPFPDGTLMQKILQHQQAEPKPVDQFRGDVPAGVTAILKRMLAKQPEDRFQTPASVALALAPYTRRSVHIPPSGSSLPTLKGTPPPAHRDDTPLPVSLGGKQAPEFERMPKAGLKRGGDPMDDTSCPQKSS